MNLKPRSISIESESPSSAVSSPSIFGGAKPVDTAAREREIEEKLRKQREKKEEEEETRKEEEEKRAKASSVFGAAKPVDTAARERQIEEKLRKMSEEQEKKEEAEEKRPEKEQTLVAPVKQVERPRVKKSSSTGSADELDDWRAPLKEEEKAVIERGARGRGGRGGESRGRGRGRGHRGGGGKDRAAPKGERKAAPVYEEPKEQVCVY